MKPTRRELLDATNGMISEFPTLLREWADNIFISEKERPAWEAKVDRKAWSIDLSQLNDAELKEMLADLVSLAEIDEPRIATLAWYVLQEARGAATDYAGYPEYESQDEACV